MKLKAHLIGLTGTNGAGKGEIAEFFKKKGYAYFSLSDVIRGELKKSGQPVTRNNLIRMGNELRRQFGADILARRVLEKVAGKAVIDSIRNPQEVECLRRHEGFFLLAIDAPPELRFQRVKDRGRDESASTFDEFVAKEREEKDGTETGQRLKACMESADILIVNDGTLDSLHQKLEALT
jgi:dephospho-CoA kinase